MRSTPEMDDLMLDALSAEQQEELAQILDEYLADLERRIAAKPGATHRSLSPSGRAIEHVLGQP